MAAAFLSKEGIEGKMLETVELGQGRANFNARLRGRRIAEGDRPRAPHGCRARVFTRRHAGSIPRAD